MAAAGLSALIRSASGAGRRIALLALVLGVVAVHGCVTQTLADRLVDLDREQAMPARIEVAYVRDMALSAPPPTAAPAAAPTAAPHRTRPAKVAKPAKPASAPEPAASVPAAARATEPVTDTTAAAVAEPVAEAAPIEPPVAAAPVPASASAPASFEWPASTRMSYDVTGNYRGEVSGSAQVEWIHVGSHYQVHLDFVVGPSFAPIITRRMSSDGEITEAGLAPRRFDQETKVVMRERNRATIVFEPGSVVLANGDRRDALPGVQDMASQFVQLTYVFSTRPELLRVGGTVDIPLALPHKVDVWTYDITAEETLNTSFGALPAIYLKPRRMTPRPGELSVEIWFAPQLRYLPARIRIHQDADTYLDLLIARRPEMAAPSSSPP